MAMFNSYVKLPEGDLGILHFFSDTTHFGIQWIKHNQTHGTLQASILERWALILETWNTSWKKTLYLPESTYLSTYLSMNYSSIQSINQSIYSIYLYLKLSTYLSTYLPIYLPT